MSRVVRVVVADVGLGNLRSVERALREAGRGCNTTVEVTRDPARIRGADRLVMPGQGAFRDCSRALAAGGLGDAVRAYLESRRPYLGICLGLQVLFASSEEAPGCSGLGVVEGRVVRLRGGIDPATGAKLEVPHVGWNTVETVSALAGRASETRRGLLPEGPPRHFYFVHSYVVAPADARIVAGTTEHGERFVSAVAFENVFACQFHPEKSAREGLALLERFLAS
jgi:imidazole glycerol-phosphate synthase subunit HisH